MQITKTRSSHQFKALKTKPPVGNPDPVDRVELSNLQKAGVGLATLTAGAFGAVPISGAIIGAGGMLMNSHRKGEAFRLGAAAVTMNLAASMLPEGVHTVPMLAVSGVLSAVSVGIGAAETYKAG